MGSSADEGQERDVLTHVVTSSHTQVCCDSVFWLSQIAKVCSMWFFWVALEGSIHGFQPCNSTDSRVRKCQAHPGSIVDQESKANQVSLNECSTLSPKPCRTLPPNMVTAGTKVPALLSSACARPPVVLISAGDPTQKSPFSFLLSSCCS